MSDDDIDFVDVATAARGGGTAATAAGFGNNDALRTLSGTVNVGSDNETAAAAAASLRRRRQESSPSPSSSSISSSARRRLPTGEGPPPPPAQQQPQRGLFACLFGRSGAFPSAVAAARSKTVIDHPDFTVTSASNFPDRLRVIKTVDVFPLRFKLKAEYLRRDRDLQCGISVRDSVLGGALRIESSTRTLSYYKSLPLSLTTSSGRHVARVGISAEVSYDGLLPLGSRGDAAALSGLALGGSGPGAPPRPAPFSFESLRPTLTFRYELGGGGSDYGGGNNVDSATWTGRDSFSLRHGFRVSPGLRMAVEARGNARLPEPKVEVRVGGGGGGTGESRERVGGVDAGASSRISLGEGRGYLHFEEVNLEMYI